MSTDGGPPSNAANPLGRVVRAANQARRRTLRRSFNDSTAPPLPTPSSLLPSHDPGIASISTTALSGSPPASPEDSRPHLFKSSRELRTRLRAMRSAEPNPTPRPRTRRRNDMLQTLLSFPEYDAATVAALLAQYDGDQAQVAAKLSQYRRPPPAKPTSRAPSVTSANTPVVSADPPQPPASQPPPPHHLSPLSQRARTSLPVAEERDVSPLAPPPQHVAAAPPPLNLGLGGSGSPVPPAPGRGHGDTLRIRRHTGRYSFPPGPNAPRSSFAEEGRVNPFTNASDASSIASSAAGSLSSAVDVGARKVRGMKRQRSSVASSDFGSEQRTPRASPEDSRSLGERAPGSDGKSDEGSATPTPGRGKPGFEAQGHPVVAPNPFGSAAAAMEGSNDALMERYRDANGVSPFGTAAPYLNESLHSAHAMQEKAQDDARIPDSEAFRMVLARITKLEAAFREYERESTAVRKELRHRLEMSELERRALEQRHKALGHELDENHKRGVKTEEYLDTMRRDLGKAIGNQQSKLTFIARSTVYNALYYVLAYLVPIFAFLLRGIRDLVGAARRRLTRSRPTPEPDGTVER